LRQEGHGISHDLRRNRLGPAISHHRGADVRAGLLLFTIFFNSSQTCPGVTDEAIPALRMAARQLESWLQNREK